MAKLVVPFVIMKTKSECVIRVLATGVLNMAPNSLLKNCTLFVIQPECTAC